MSMVIIDMKKPDVNGFARLIPRSRSHSIEEGIQARVNDPLWFLSRQWQLGEFQGKNGGTIANTEVAASSGSIDGVKLDLHNEFEGLASKELPSSLPLETVVEGEHLSAEKVKPPAWNAEQLEYQFSIKIGEMVLAAEKYDGDRLDWYDFNLGSEVSTNGSEKEEFYVMPEAISFPGMPSSRWWQLEDATIDLGGIRRPNLNFLSMLLIEFAMVYANNWFVIPLKQKVGSLRVIEKVTVIDSFGICDEIEPVVDTGRNEQPWSMYTLTGNKNHPSAGTRVFFLPNTVVHELTGEPIETVSISRDEAANIVWAIEHRYLDELEGKVKNRDDEEAANPPEPLTVDPYPLYRLKSHLPLNWIPYIAVQNSQPGDIILRRGRTDENASSEEPQYKGKLIREAKRINEDVVPSITIQLSRRYKLIACEPEKWQLAKVRVGEEEKWQLKRVREKKVYAWLGRNKKTSEKHGQINLRFDFLE